MKTSLNIFERGNCWKVSPAKDASSFFRQLLDLVPAGSVLYLEGGGKPPDDIDAFLSAKKFADNVVIPGGTLLPTPQIYRLAVSQKNLEALARLSAKHPTPIGSIHVHVYHGNDVLLLGYDAFLDPFHISKDIPEMKIKAFCDRLGLQHEEVKERDTKL